MAYNADKLHKMENALRSTSELVGEIQEKPNEDNIIVGLGLTDKSVICLNAADAVKEGVFKTIVMGTFNNGKSTIINALIGSKVLPEAVTPATAIISYIRYGGKDEDKKTFVYYTDGSVQEMNAQDFFKEYKFTNEDAAECRATGGVSRFKNVDYSIVYCNNQLLQNGVQIIDSPGLEDKECATKLTLNSASNANAIIYTGSVPSGGFDIYEQDYFKSNFEGRHLNNIFFLINKSDLLLDETDLQHLKDYIKVQLTDVFKDEKNAFNEELYNKRVFFISARNVLEYKTNCHSNTYTERDLYEFQRFEKELEEFLTTDARSIATFNSCFEKIANAYNAAIHVAELNKSAKKKGVDEVTQEIYRANENLDRMEAKLDSLRKSFTVAKTKTETVFIEQLQSIADNINNTWDTEMAEIVENSGFATGDLMCIAWQAIRYINNPQQRDEAFAERIAPITTGVERFIRIKIEEGVSSAVTLNRKIIKDLQQEIEKTQIELDKLLIEVYDMFNVDGSNVKKGNVNLVKLVGAFANTDPNVMIELLAGNDMGWMDFLKRAMVEKIMDSILFSIVGGPIGFALFVLKEWWALRKGRARFSSQLAIQTKNQLIDQLKKKIVENKDDMFSIIGQVYDVEFERISNDVRGKIKEERNLLEGLNNNLSNAEFNYESEIKKCEYIVNQIWSNASDAYKYVFGRVLSREDFVKLSVN